MRLPFINGATFALAFFAAAPASASVAGRAELVVMGGNSRPEPHPTHDMLPVVYSDVATTSSTKELVPRNKEPPLEWRPDLEESMTKKEHKEMMDTLVEGNFVYIEGPDGQIFTAVAVPDPQTGEPYAAFIEGRWKMEKKIDWERCRATLAGIVIGSFIGFGMMNWRRTGEIKTLFGTKGNRSFKPPRPAGWNKRKADVNEARVLRAETNQKLVGVQLEIKRFNRRLKDMYEATKKKFKEPKKGSVKIVQKRNIKRETNNEARALAGEATKSHPEKRAFFIPAIPAAWKAGATAVTFTSRARSLGSAGKRLWTGLKRFKNGTKKKTKDFRTPNIKGKHRKKTAKQRRKELRKAENKKSKAWHKKQTKGLKAERKELKAARAAQNHMIRKRWFALLNLLVSGLFIYMDCMPQYTGELIEQS